jgi:acetyl-CoA carboxylase biotin carboxyl carrier protein
MPVQIEAQVTGRVVRVEKKIGDRVEPEDVLLVLESMKMEIPLEATCAGSITQVLVGEGDSVAEGDVLVVLD